MVPAMVCVLHSGLRALAPSEPSDLIKKKSSGAAPVLGAWAADDCDGGCGCFEEVWCKGSIRRFVRCKIHCCPYPIDGIILPTSPIYLAHINTIMPTILGGPLVALCLARA